MINTNILFYYAKRREGFKSQVPTASPEGKKVKNKGTQTKSVGKKGKKKSKKKVEEDEEVIAIPKAPRQRRKNGNHEEPSTSVEVLVDKKAI